MHKIDFTEQIARGWLSLLYMDSWGWTIHRSSHPQRWPPRSTLPDRGRWQLRPESCLTFVFFFIWCFLSFRSSHDFVILPGLHAQARLASMSGMARIECILMTLCMMLTSCSALEALRKQELHKPKDFHSCSACRTISSSSGGTVGCDVAALEWINHGWKGMSLRPTSHPFSGSPTQSTLEFNETSAASPNTQHTSCLRACSRKIL